MKIIISGAYAIGTHLAKLLSRNNQDTVLIDDEMNTHYSHYHFSPFCGFSDTLRKPPIAV